MTQDRNKQGEFKKDNQGEGRKEKDVNANNVRTGREGAAGGKLDTDNANSDQ